MRTFLAELRKRPSEMFVFGFLLLLICGFLRWALVGRITHDEGIFLGAAWKLLQTGEVGHFYKGYYGSSWIVTVGPTLYVPLAILNFFLIPLASLFNIQVQLLTLPFSRMFLFATCLGLFALSMRLWDVRLRQGLVVLFFFFLWCLCLPAKPFVAEGSINMFTQTYGEGLAFFFVLLTFALLRTQWRDLALVTATLAVGSKLVALWLVVVPAMSVLRDGRRALRGFLIAGSLILSWQLWQLWQLGVSGYFENWTGYISWLSRGGGYRRDFSSTIFEKWEQIGVAASPVIFLGLIVTGLWFIHFSKKKIPEGRLFASAVGVFCFWYFFIASRGWVRHFWPCYALIGMWVAFTLKEYFFQKKLDLKSVALVVALFVTGIAYGGTSLVFGSLDESLRWKPQMQIAREIKSKVLDRRPHALLFVHSWHMVTQVAYFLERPTYNLLQYQIRRGDVILCAHEGDCTDELKQWCKPRLNAAGFGYCVY